VDESIRANERADGLYHAYNLVEFGGRGGIPVQRFACDAGRSGGDFGRQCSLRRRVVARVVRIAAEPDVPRQPATYMLYPDRRLPRFLEKEQIPASAVSRSALFKRLLADGNTQLIERDVAGVCHFHPRITNAGDVQVILSQLAAAGYARQVNASHVGPGAIRKMFDHRSFTGRSGTFFGYEGLGCIFWHMVSNCGSRRRNLFSRRRRDRRPAREVYHRHPRRHR